MKRDIFTHSFFELSFAIATIAEIVSDLTRSQRVESVADNISGIFLIITIIGIIVLLLGKGKIKDPLARYSKLISWILVISIMVQLVVMFIHPVNIENDAILPILGVLSLIIIGTVVLLSMRKSEDNE